LILANSLDSATAKQNELNQVKSGGGAGAGTNEW
jgi:hypothetical protein